MSGRRYSDRTATSVGWAIQWISWATLALGVVLIVVGASVKHARDAQSPVPVHQVAWAQAEGDTGEAGGGAAEGADAADKGAADAEGDKAEGEEEGEAKSDAGGAAPASSLRESSGTEGVMGKAVSFLGIFAFIGLAFLMSNNRKKVDWRLVIIGTLMQLVFGALIFYAPYGREAFDLANDLFTKLLGFTNEGSKFLFGSFVLQGEVQPAMINFAFNVLPTIIFFSSLMTVLYHLGVMQFIVKGFAYAMQKLLNTSGAETLSASANIFVGQTEAPLVVKPFIKEMTMSELMTVMTGGFATVAGGVLAAYVGMLQGIFPDIAGHLIAASVMSAPAALVIGKIIYPETETPTTLGKLEMPPANEDEEDDTIIGAAASGAGEGLTLALNVGAMLLAFVALIALINAIIGWSASLIGLDGVTLELIFGYLFWPIAWLMGVPAADCYYIGQLLGTKMVINEFVAYINLSTMLSDPAIVLSKRSVIIATYALCGFANFGSIAIQIGGLGAIAPERRKDLARLGLRAMIAGSLAAFMTATIAGVLV